MADKSKIEWTDATWNPVTGCTRVSTGCENCYAERLAAGRLRSHPSRQGLTDEHGRWNGEVRLNEQWLDQPLRWKRPRRIFVCAHSDLFHPAVHGEWINKVFRIMRRSDRHQFQVLTKRPERMRDYVRPRVRLPDHIWLGVSIEDQRTADERLPLLLDTPAAVRWVSAEPLLGPVCLAGMDWVVVGGESGPGARPMDPRWARGIRDQCAAAGTPFFLKQMAGKAPIPVDLMIREWPRGARHG